MGHDNFHLGRAFIIITILIGGITYGHKAYAAFPIPAAPKIIQDSTKSRYHRPTEQQMHTRNVIAITFSVAAIGCITAAAILFVPGLLIGWFALSLVAMVLARNAYSKKTRYTFAEILSFIAFLPAVAVVAGILAVAFIVFGLPRLLVNKIRGRKTKFPM